MNVHLLSIVNGPINVLSHAIEHYRETLCVSSFHIHILVDAPDDPALAAVNSILSLLGIQPASIQFQRNLIDVKRHVFSQTAEMFPNDWFIIADQDELQVYPEDAIKLLEDCERQGFNQILGTHVDRVGPAGTLPRVRREMPLWPQFPLGGFLAHPLLCDSPVRVAAAKGSVLTSALERPVNLHGPACCPLDAGHVQIHHFKWTDGMLGPLQESVCSLRDGDHSTGDMRLIEYFSRNTGRFNVLDPRFFLAPCTPDYGEWTSVELMIRHYVEHGWLPTIESIGDQTICAINPPVRLNIGGAGHGQFIGDMSGAMDGKVYAVTNEIDLSSVSEPAPMKVYSSFRWGACHYVFTRLAPHKAYRVRLHFAEVFHSQPANRQFGVYVNGRCVLKNFDIISSAGGPYRAIIKSGFVKTSSTGTIEVTFGIGGRDQPIICAIEILETEDETEHVLSGEIASGHESERA